MKNLYLVGMMGCGKSTCARLLSRRLGLPALDTDEEIERREGRSISEIFAADGEDFFRRLETEFLWTLSDREDLIVACGGGLPLRAENRAILRESGVVVFLNRDPAEIYDSVDMAARPLGQDGKESFLRRFAQREPLYRAAAHIVIERPGTPEETAGQILREMEAFL